jgi:hypothetical protein
MNCPVGTDLVQYIEANGKVVKTTRRVVKDPATNRTFSFCESCCNVLAIVNGVDKPKPKTKPKKQNANRKNTAKTPRTKTRRKSQ